MGMQKTITKWLAGAAVLMALGAALPLQAQEQASAPAASAAASVPAASAPAASAEAAAPAVAPAAAAAPAPAAAPAAAPTPQKGDTAWMFVATLLVIMMTVPGLALFYGGLVRSKNMLSILLQVFMIFSVIIVLWCIYGYSLA
ncbi:MAG TPA: ammonia channel protein, partial [Telluria sp.]|nr:ammonia channel protein [Telluria sp.]